jgi:predicted lipid-binding transport protein (Tim44 family)
MGVVVIVRMLLSRRAPAAAPSRYADASASASVAAGPRRVEPVLMPAASSPPSTNFAKPLPPGFDAEGFLRQAKLQFRRLQAAWDEGDRQALADVMSPGMMDEIGTDLAARGDHRGTEVVTLNAEMLEVTTEGGHHWASVRFTGLVREVGAPVPETLDEIWNLTKPVDGSSGWLLAGIRQAA